MDAKAHLQLENRVQEIAPALDRIEALLSEGGADQQVMFRVRLALDELITNIVTHGFPQGGTHSIGIEVAVEADHLAVELKDDGIAFNPLLVAEPAPESALEDRQVGGLGLHFVRRVIPELSYRRAGGCNVLSLGTPLRG